MAWKVLFTLVVVIACFPVARVCSYTLTMQPLHVRPHVNTSILTFYCSASVPIEVCEFTWLDASGVAGPLIDFSHGRRSQIDLLLLDESLNAYSYSGRGLNQGDCGISLQVTGWKHWLVSCRVFASNAGFKYAWANLYAARHAALDVAVFPREVFVSPGQDASLMIKSQRPLTSCWFYPPSTPGDGLEFDKGSASPTSTGHHVYHGSGTASGECGLAIRNVSEADNGYVRGYVWKSGAAEYRYIPVIVADPPGSPTLGLVYQETNLSATCTVGASRPVASITWFLDDELIRQDSNDDSPLDRDARWRWPWDRAAITQVFKRKLKASDRRKRLTCRVSHPALPQTLNASEEIVFTDCGRRKTNSGSVLISNGEDAKVGEFPWHVAIYRQPEGLQTPIQICAGSLITTRLVLSAAHSFYDAANGRMRNSSEYKVAAGKHLRDWEDPDPTVQKRNVTDIRHKLFGDLDRTYASDIALVYLSEPVEVNAKVNLVCVDWLNSFELRQFHTGGVGVVPGWGFTEDGTQSNELKYIDLPYVPAEVCYDSLTRNLRPFLTNDKFCAGYRNESRSVCTGDAGGGLVFLDERTGNYYLRGIVSVAFRLEDFDGGECYADNYVGFTLVSQYIIWMQNNIDSYT